MNANSSIQNPVTAIRGRRKKTGAHDCMRFCSWLLSYNYVLHPCAAILEMRRTAISKLAKLLDHRNRLLAIQVQMLEAIHKNREVHTKDITLAHQSVCLFICPLMKCIRWNSSILKCSWKSMAQLSRLGVSPFKIAKLEPSLLITYGFDGNCKRRSWITTLCRPLQLWKS